MAGEKATRRNKANPMTGDLGIKVSDFQHPIVACGGDRLCHGYYRLVNYNIHARAVHTLAFFA